MKPKNNYGWTKNWSSRGTAMMNSVETFTRTDGALKKITEPSVSEKLKYLISVKPDSRFYQSLTSQMKSRRSLSLKQLQAISKDYNTFK